MVDLVGVDHAGFGTDLTEEINPIEMMTETGELGNWPNEPYRPVVYPPLPFDQTIRVTNMGVAPK